MNYSDDCKYKIILNFYKDAKFHYPHIFKTRLLFRSTHYQSSLTVGSFESGRSNNTVWVNIPHFVTHLIIVDPLTSTNIEKNIVKVDKLSCPCHEEMPDQKSNLTIHYSCTQLWYTSWLFVCNLFLPFVLNASARSTMVWSFTRSSSCE